MASAQPKPDFEREVMASAQPKPDFEREVAFANSATPDLPGYRVERMGTSRL